MPHIRIARVLVAGVLSVGPVVIASYSASSATCTSSMSASPSCSVGGTAKVTAGVLSVGGPTTVKWANALTGVTTNVSAALTLTAIDATGSGAGWTLSASVSQVTDATGTTSCKATKTCRLPASRISFNGSSTTANSTARPVATCATGSTCTLPINSVNYPVTLTGSTPVPSILANAATTTGMGAVKLASDWWLAIPANAYAGTYTDTVTLTLSSGPEIAPPTVTAVSPNVGRATTKTKVTISGTNFTTVTSVTFGGTPATVTKVTGSTRLTATAPSKRAGTDSVVVTAEGGASTVDGTFTYLGVPTLTTVTPTAGKLAGGTVTLSGSGFANGATSVTFGAGNHGATVHVSSTTSLTVKAPAHAAGAVTVTVTTPGGTSGTKPYTYDPIPTIASLSRTSGPTTGGTQVTVTGTGFSSVASVKFGTTTAQSFTVRSATQLVTTSPVHAAGTAGVSVTTPGGSSPATPADLYKFTVSAPAVSAISPASGPAAGGTTVTVSGSGFTGATTVYFGTAKGKTVSVNAAGTQLTVKSPAGTSGASVNVRVATPASESPAVTADLFTYGPTITSLSRTSGPVAGGTKVTIAGTGFSTVQSVKFGTTAATAFTVSSSTSIIATSPAHAAGQVRISVTTAAGTTPSTSADLYTYP